MDAEERQAVVQAQGLCCVVIMGVSNLSLGCLNPARCNEWPQPGPEL